EIRVRPLAPIDLPVAFVIAPDRAQHPGPRARDSEVTATDLDLLARAVEQFGVDAGKRSRRRAGLGRGDTGERCDHDPARLRLPPCIDDRAAPAADVLLVPHPRFGVDRFAHRAEEPEL